MNFQILFQFLCSLLFTSLKGVYNLKNVRLEAVEAVRAGDSLQLRCDYDLEDALLYSVKWYFDDNEFYRYVPKESPPTRVFPLPGIIVDISRSNEKDVLLHDVQKSLTGYYKCEVSADAPLFHTDIKSTLIIVAEEPKLSPILTLEKNKYSVGEYIRGNCTSYGGYPAAQITWFINEHNMINSSAFTRIDMRVIKEAGGTESSISKLEILATADLFQNHKIIIKCQASQFKLYSQSSIAVLEHDTPQLAHVLSPSSSETQNACACLRISILFLLVILLLLSIVRPL